MARIVTLNDIVKSTVTASESLSMLLHLSQIDLQKLLVDDKFHDLVDMLAKQKTEIKGMVQMMKESIVEEKKRKAIKKTKHSADEERRMKGLQWVMDLYIAILHETSDANIIRLKDKTERQGVELVCGENKSKYNFAVWHFESTLARTHMRTTMNNAELICIVKNALECRDEYINETHAMNEEWRAEFDQRNFIYKWKTIKNIAPLVRLVASGTDADRMDIHIDESLTIEANNIDDDAVLSEFIDANNKDNKDEDEDKNDDMPDEITEEDLEDFDGIVAPQ
eukprot:m51a1_g13468 hypothetical protein (281) ;mRNA; f:1082-2137